jgi:hypothetical protein
VESIETNNRHLIDELHDLSGAIERANIKAPACFAARRAL